MTTRHEPEAVHANTALIAAQRAVSNQQIARGQALSHRSNASSKRSSPAPISASRGSRLQGNADVPEIALSTPLTSLSVTAASSEPELASIQRKTGTSWAVVARVDSPQRIGLLVVCLVALWIIHSRMMYFFAAFTACIITYAFLQYTQLKTKEKFFLKALPASEWYKREYMQRRPVGAPHSVISNEEVD
ncbi:hypothetical protein AOQ84DRAFT_154059 [Glonium stellatum]|uniref:Uncharacterized protein n=1 Tax=Glonium stellatum TaxID=574774 RepID=A0A8E2ERI1_9PEZI|nr:hypothetical protein AOQ84DRAFT_154059 [Glonium stellatum]